MIFVAVGTQKAQLNRLLIKIDNIAERGRIKEEFFAQTGYSDYTPRNYPFQDFVDQKRFESLVRGCSILITHGGVGTIMAGIANEKPILVFPRLARYGEHVDDHQLDIANAFYAKNYVLKCGEEDDLEELIFACRSHQFSRYVSCRKEMLCVIRDYLNSI